MGGGPSRQDHQRFKAEEDRRRNDEQIRVAVEKQQREAAEQLAAKERELQEIERQISELQLQQRQDEESQQQHHQQKMGLLQKQLDDVQENAKELFARSQVTAESLVEKVVSHFRLLTAL